MTDQWQVGTGMHADPQVTLGYPGDRLPAGPLVVGPDARFRSGTVVYLGTRIGARFQSGHHVVVREECDIGDDVSVWSNTVIDYGCRIADGVKIHSNCYIAQYTEIGAGAFLAPGVTVANDLYPGDDDSREHMSGPSIGADAQVGVNVTLLPFVRLGEGSLIGAGSVVTRDIPAGMVAFGNPAVVRGRVTELTGVTTRVEAVDSASRFRLSTSGVDPWARSGE
jgi:acetyltransferase-like isoleucine patch superfamily enzyme